MINVILLFALLATSTTAASSESKEVGYKQFILGAELSALKKTNQLKCATPHEDIVECQVLGKQTILEKPVESVSLHFADGRLGKITLIVYPGRNAFHLVQNGTELSGPSVENKRFVGELLSVLRAKLSVEPMIHKPNQSNGLIGSIPIYTWTADKAIVTLAQHKPNYGWLTLTYTSNVFTVALNDRAQVRARADAVLAPQRMRDEAERSRKRQSDI
jgi:hypothetical protein